MMQFDELCRMLSDYTQIGFMEAVKAYEPAQDLIRASDLKKWLKMMLIEEKKFKPLVKAGKIRPRKIGKKKNSPIYYSKKQIKSAIAAAKLSTIMTRERTDDLIPRFAELSEDLPYWQD